MKDKKIILHLTGQVFYHGVHEQSNSQNHALFVRGVGCLTSWLDANYDEFGILRCVHIYGGMQLDQELASNHNGVEGSGCFFWGEEGL